MTAVVDEQPAPTTLVVDRPGVYDLPADVYLRDPVPGGSLSSTGAKRLLPPSCPALFRYAADSPKPYVAEFAIGHAAHLLVLGTGPELHVVDAANWQTKAARAERDAAHTAGLVPLLVHEFDQVQAMADALRRHRRAAELLDAASEGVAEQSLFWRDPKTGVWCRARPDWATPYELVDYKTTTDVDPVSIARTVAAYSYQIQATHYLAGAVELDIVDPAAPFYFIFQSKTQPYLVHVVELDDEALDDGRQRLARARQVFAECTATGVWPGYDDIELISLPGWVRRQSLELL